MVTTRAMPWAFMWMPLRGGNNGATSKLARRVNHLLADRRTLVRASSGSSMTWPTIRWDGSSIRSRFKSRISLARCESPSMSRAIDRSVSYGRIL